MIHVHPIESILNAYIENQDLQPNTIKDYKYMIKTYIEYLKKNNIEYAKRSDIIKFKNFLLNSNLLPRSVQKYIMVLKGFYKWMSYSWYEYELDERYQHDISIGIKNIDTRRSFAKDGLSLDETKKLLSVANQYTNTISGLRNYCMILLMITGGLRMIELSRARKSNLRKLKGYDVLYIHGKGRDYEDEFIKISEPVMKALDEYLFLRQDRNPFLFIGDHKNNEIHQLSTDTIRGAITKLLVEADLKNPHITPHSLRHTCAMLSIETGNSIHDTQQLLRHSNITTTYIYVHQVSRLRSNTSERITKHLEIREE